MKAPKTGSCFKVARSCMAALAMLATASAGNAATLRVASSGENFTECGRSGLVPCRSITQAIANASSGDTIIVGPGFYGDLDGSGTVGDSPGEEVPAGGITMIDVTKKLTIISGNGAGATVLDAAGMNTAVHIAADGVVFGKPNHGFSIKNATSNGLYIAAASVTARGNMAAFDVTGIIVEGAGVVLSGNAAVGNSEGIIGDTDTTITGNLLQANWTGMIVSGGSVTKNVAVDNDVGVNISGNTLALVFNHNAVVANHSAGVQVSLPPFPTTVSVTLDHNDYFGNGDRGTPWNCGLLLQATVAGSSISVTSTNDFWGAGAPGSDPADDAGGACNTGPGTITLTVNTPATKEIVVKPPHIR